MSILSHFKNKTTPSHCEPFPGIIHKIRRGYCADEIHLLREYIAACNESAARSVLAYIPRFSPGGHFDGGRSREAMVSYSGIVMLETAYLPADLLSEYRKTIQSCQYTNACFLSSEGDTLRLFIKVNSTADHHAEAYAQVLRYYEKTLHITILTDKMGLLSLCPFSYDPDAYFNPDSDTFAINTEPTPPVTQPCRKSVCLTLKKTTNGSVKPLQVQPTV